MMTVSFMTIFYSMVNGKKYNVNMPENLSTCQMIVYKQDNYVDYVDKLQIYLGNLIFI